MPFAALKRVVNDLGPNNSLLALPFCLVVDVLGIGSRRGGSVCALDIIARVGVIGEHALASIAV